MSSNLLPSIDISHFTTCGNLKNYPIFQNGFTFVVFYRNDCDRNCIETVKAFAEFNKQKQKLLPSNISKRVAVYGYEVNKPNSHNNIITSWNQMCFRIQGYPLVVFFSNGMFCGKYRPNALPAPDKIAFEFADFCRKLTASACEKCVWEEQTKKKTCDDTEQRKVKK